MGSWYDPTLGTPKAIGKLLLPKLTGLAWAPGKLGGRTFQKLAFKVNVADPPHIPLWVTRGLVLGHLNLLLYPPFSASGATSRLSSQDQWLTPH